MDGLLLPPHLVEGEAQQEFHGLAMDATSSPGGHHFSDDNDLDQQNSWPEHLDRPVQHFRN